FVLYPNLIYCQIVNFQIALSFHFTFEAKLYIIKPKASCSTVMDQFCDFLQLKTLLKENFIYFTGNRALEVTLLWMIWTARSSPFWHRTRGCPSRRSPSTSP